MRATQLRARSPHERRVPAVAHACWEAPDGRWGVVLANWTRDPQTVMLCDARLGESVVVDSCGRTTTTARVAAGDRELAVTVPPLGCVLVSSGG